MKEDSLFFNREFSWLQFNTRVLNQASREDFPLLERLKFLAIYATNLDEFYMIRIAGLKRLFANGITQTGADRLSVKAQLDAIKSSLRAQKHELERVYSELCAALAKEGFVIGVFENLGASEKSQMQDFFESQLYPIIVPMVVDSTHPFPHLNNLSFGITLRLRCKESGEVKFGIVRIPRILKRFIRVKKGHFVSIESVVGAFAHRLFDGFEVLGFLSFRITRNADIEVEEHEADDFIVLMSEGIKARRKGSIVRVEFGGSSEESELQEFIKAHIGIRDNDAYFYTTLLNMASLWEVFGDEDFAHLRLRPFVPKILPPLDDKSDIFAHIKKQDFLFFHPYESFDSISEFIHQASKDPAVLSIKMTLYRVGKDSPIVEALIRAAESKQVTALVELKARFDEENNLHWAKALESAGAHVIYGIPKLKVHAKVALVIRREGERLQGYVHLSSGNYNPMSAKIYTDISFLTANPCFTEDISRFFHALSVGTAVSKATLSTLLIAPMQIKPKLLELIAKESTKGKAGHIILKANALVDSDIIHALYEASRAGVKVELIIRGICALVPQVAGMSENIFVYSLVGKYLEHARIYYFKHHEEIYFSSADLMPRNLERRVEMLVPISDARLCQRMLEILQKQLSDDVNRYVLQSDGSYQLVARQSGIDAQTYYEEWVNKLYLLQTPQEG